MKKSKGKGIPKKVNNYIIEQKLFEINISSFYVGKNIYINEKVLVRIFQKKDLNKKLDEISNINNEILLLKLINHKNFLRLYEIIESKDYIFLIYEYFECNSLSNFIKNKKLNEKEILVILYKIIISMIYIHHTMRICHLTLNLDSILIDKDLNVKIINFKYGCIYSKDLENYEDNQDMNLFSCPEMHAKQKYNPELADVYSCGVIIYYLYCGELPFNSNRKIINDELIMKGEYTLPENTSKLMFKVITLLMEVDPTKRKKFKELLNEDWFKDISSKSEEKKEVRGLNIFHEKYPIDDNVMKICEQYKMNKKDIFKYLNNNIFNGITSLYKQIEKILNKKGINTMGDLYSEKFISYLNNNLNFYDNEENKHLHEKIKKEENHNKENIKEIKTNIENKHLEVYEEFKKLKDKYDKTEKKTEKKIEKKIEKKNEIDPSKMSKRRRSQMYGQQLSNNLINLANSSNKKKEENNIKKINNNDPTNFLATKEINVGFSMNEKKEKQKEKEKEKEKNRNYKKRLSQKDNEEKKNEKDTKKNLILKNNKKGKIRRGSSIISETNVLNVEQKNIDRKSLNRNFSNFDEFIAEYYQKKEENENKKENKKEEENKDNKSIKSNNSKKSNKSNKKITEEKKIDYKKSKSIKKNKDKDLKDNSNYINIKKKKSIEIKKEEKVTPDILQSGGLNQKKKENKDNNQEIKNEINQRNLSEIKNQKKILKDNEHKEKIVKSKSIKEINNNINDGSKEIKKTPVNINQISNINQINKKSPKNNNQNIKIVKDINENKKEKKENKKEIITKKEEKENKKEIITKKEEKENKKELINKKEEKENKSVKINKSEKVDKNKEIINKNNNKKEKESKSPKNINKEKKESNLKEKPRKKEVVFKNIEASQIKKEEKKKEKKKLDNEKMKESEKKNVNDIYNGLFLNIAINKKNGNENINNINSNPNRTQSHLALKNLNLREDLFNYMKSMQNINTKTNMKHRKIKDKKAKIKKFSDENKSQEQINHIPLKRNKIKNNNQNLEGISLNKYKRYLNALFNDNNNKINNINKINNNYYSPTNNINNSLPKKNNNYNYYNYTVDNDKNESFILDESNSKNKFSTKSNVKKSKNQKTKDKFISHVLTSIPNSNSQQKKTEINNDKDSNDEDNDKLYNEYWNSINNSFKKKKKNYHKRIKSCNNPSDNNYYNKKQTIDIKSNLNNKFYKGENRSVNILNNINKNKNKRTSNKKIRKKQFGNNNNLSVSTLKDKDIKNITKNNILYNTRNNNSDMSDFSSMSAYNLNLEELKARLKEKLISVTYGLRAQLIFYEGPINIRNISINNYEETINNLINIIKINGYQYSRIKDNIFKCFKGNKSIEIEIVKIKGNFLYYLIKK